MKKHITFDKIAYAMSLSTFIFIAVTLCTACVELQKRTSENRKQMQEEVRAMFANIEKPL
jgi:heme/copper-type cytochrome/quinol oxidase subunit 2